MEKTKTKSYMIGGTQELISGYLDKWKICENEKGIKI